MFDCAVFGFLPKCASIGAILVILFGMSLILCIMFAMIVDLSSEDHSGSIVITPSFRFIVWINLPTIPVALWSLAGANISFLLLSSQYTLKSLNLNAFAWSHRMERGIPWSLQYSSKNLIAVDASQFLYTCAVGNLEYLSTDTKIY